jgi:plastocyanin
MAVFVGEDALPRISLVCVACALLLSACGVGGPAHGPPAANVAATVDMGFFDFSPAQVTVRVGDTVEWRNRSLITHTVTDDPAHADKALDAALPAGAPPFDSQDIAAGQIYLHRFTVPGSYRYFCMHHEGEGMVATVVVLP